jgi:hypothetical protein
LAQRAGQKELWRISPGYEVVLNGNLSNLRFAEKDAAERAADLIRRASEICRAAPIQVIAAAGEPGLAETLHYIQEKLNDEPTASSTRFAVRGQTDQNGSCTSQAVPPPGEHHAGGRLMSFICGS